MPDLNSLGFAPDEEIPADDIQTIPEGSGGFELLQPGNHTFTLPTAEKGFSDKEAVERGFFSKSVGSDQKDYLQVNFRGKDKGWPLKVKGGGNYFTQINNRPYTAQGKKVNDLLLILKALGHTETPRTNAEYAAALLKYAGQSFGAEQVLTARATTDKHGFDMSLASYVKPGDVYTGKNSGKQTHGLPKQADGKYAEEIEVNGKTLRVFGNLRSFFSVGNGAA